MSKIIVLDELTACQIAAGEVIERPASVVKELAENSIDAGATIITVEIRAGGVKYIRITDNGCGFEADDAVIAFDKHATSKIHCGEDLDNITTLGFRGEALASIASVADVELLSKTEDADAGIYVHIKGCELLETSEKGSPKGSSITVRDLFYNTPARYKFLKKDSTEASHIIDILQKLAMANPAISFRLISNGNEVFRTPGNGDLKSVLFSIFGKETSNNILPVQYETDGYRLSGFAGVRDAVYSSRARQILFVNCRCIRSKVILSALDEAYKTVTMKNKYPFAVIMLEVPAGKVDVNVHPAKAEVRFSDESGIYRVVYNGVSNALLHENNGKTIKAESYVLQKPAAQVQLKTAVEPEQVPFVITSKIESSDKISEARQFNEIHRNPEIPKIPEVPEIPVVEEISDSDIESNTKLPEIWTKESEVRDEAGAEISPLNTSAKQEENDTETPVLYNSTNVYTDGTIIGQVFNTYIVLEYGDDVVMIDQHAAHERIKYEEIKDSVNNQNCAVSPMLVPISMKLAPAEYAALKGNMDFFDAMGFEIDDFGENMIIIRAVPTILSDSNIEDVILSGLQNKKTKGYTDEEIYTMACKAAVKANKKLSHFEIEELLSRLAKLENSGTCPHGRPISVTITKHELERRFKRCL